MYTTRGDHALPFDGLPPGLRAPDPPLLRLSKIRRQLLLNWPATRCLCDNACYQHRLALMECTPCGDHALPRRALPLATVPPERVLRAFPQLRPEIIRQLAPRRRQCFATTLCLPLRRRRHPPPTAATVRPATVPLTVFLPRWSLLILPGNPEFVYGKNFKENHKVK